MEAVHTHNNSSHHPLEKAMHAFFLQNSPESVQLLLWKMFQCWVTKDCSLKAGLPDAEVALVFDQLNDLIAAAYAVHQTSHFSATEQKGNGHE
ncbi:hypothetical protein HH214_08855 [Mucilaginibacter robiniae]|uniref:Uncharacterized protein n=1 Tax=Mucilaginibacter robiniae TaxID=2728022 RepID=A0A7L5E0F8_9SPHI|nr:hypothetical protein [Mucilaginibacter robiniae]QJD95978.1 hypothetical protein HH214_08855 [Mucilaginibacter robiniae]